MLSRSSAVVPVARTLISRNVPAAVVTKRLAHGPPANYKFPTMDEMLVPCGSWQEHYDNMQRKYNIQLLLGSGFFVITFLVGVFSHAFDLHMFLPDRPAPKNSNS